MLCFFFPLPMLDQTTHIQERLLGFEAKPTNKECRCLGHVYNTNSINMKINHVFHLDSMVLVAETEHHRSLLLLFQDQKRGRKRIDVVAVPGGRWDVHWLNHKRLG